MFLLPGVSLPPSSAAAVYLSLPQTPADFRFLGAIGPSKESAVFKISGLGDNLQETEANITVGTNVGGLAEIDMDAPEDLTTNTASTTYPAGEILIGISIEPAEVVAAQMTSLQAANDAKRSALNTTSDASSELSQALVTMQKPRPNTLLLAQNIIKDAFNFLSSYSSPSTDGEMVPLKAFEDWWRKFESKSKRDPSFLEKIDVA